VPYYCRDLRHFRHHRHKITSPVTMCSDRTAPPFPRPKFGASGVRLIPSQEICTIPVHFGYCVQPQKERPSCLPFVATRRTIAVPHRGHAGESSPSGRAIRISLSSPGDGESEARLRLASRILGRTPSTPLPRPVAIYDTTYCRRTLLATTVAELLRRLIQSVRRTNPSQALSFRAPATPAP
jgi:hypothetical protein